METLLNIYRLRAGKKLQDILKVEEYELYYRGIYEINNKNEAIKSMEQTI
jgi:hypothetical protein